MTSEINIILYTASMVIFGIIALILFNRYDD
jgi:hypothetical protein